MDKLQPIGGNLEIFVSKEHRYGTDAVMLSYFSKVKSKDKVCELGTGCGIISLLLSREQKPQILAVDIQQNAIDLVQKSIEYNKLNNITPLCADLKTLKGKQDFDVVIMNPPYKKANAGLHSDNDSIKIARSEIMCNLSDIIDCADRLLKYSGRLCMCQRPERMTDLICAMRDKKIEPKRVRFVHIRDNKEPMLVLVEGIKGASSGLKAEPPLIIEKHDGTYTDEAEQIYALYRQARG
ncbi:MAG: tRNA1(Val) (adenine(37)-N6)-methyltransferase [Acutalibacteraceae bacterium]|nr:tRNA1(Val) (adenine(37)-N6)-methyltransferase [Acutalibacteraceae bacterium]